ncbi:MAG: alpha/beta hydrolase [Opitutales bacterium]|nr:alpha/beta hydrolase [Opitutales bacterium]
MPSLRILGLLLLVYGLFVLLVAGCQRRLIYHPSRAAEGFLMRMAEEGGLLPWVDANGQFHGWRRPFAEERPPNQVLIFHGNAGFALHRTYLIDLFPPGDWDVRVLEYPGYGARSGSPSEAAFHRAAEAAIAALRSEAGEGPLLLVGESIGSGVAVRAAAGQPDRVGGLLLLTPFTSLTDVARSHYPFLPVNLLLRDRFENDTALPLFSGPVAFVLAENDRVVPTRLGRALYESHTGPKWLWVEPGSDHNTLTFFPGAEWWQGTLAFFRGHGFSSEHGGDGRANP